MRALRGPLTGTLRIHQALGSAHAHAACVTAQVLKRYFTPASAVVAEAALVRVVTGRNAERALAPIASGDVGSPGAAPPLGGNRFSAIDLGVNVRDAITRGQPPLLITKHRSKERLG